MAALAWSQHGTVARGQLRARGLSAAAIDHAVATGRLHVVHRGAYAVGHARLTAHGRWMAAVLAVGPGSVLAQWTAAALLDLAPTGGGHVHVATTRRGARPRPGIRVHRVRALPAADVALVAGIPVTTVPRTLADVASVSGPRRIGRLLEEAERRRAVDWRDLRARCDPSRRAPGARALRAAIERFDPRVLETRSPLEARFLAVVREAGLPAPVVNVRVGGLEVDALWPDRGVVVELDGWAYHRTRAAFERDRERSAILEAAGLRAVRVTDRMLDTGREALVARLRAMLGARARPPASPATGRPPGSPTAGAPTSPATAQAPTSPATARAPPRRPA